MKVLKIPLLALALFAVSWAVLLAFSYYRGAVFTTTIVIGAVIYLGTARAFESDSAAPSP